MTVSTSFASRILLAISSVLAFLALGLPFALESGAAPTESFEKLFGGTQVWSGWSLARASRNDGHLPVSTAPVVILVVATACLVVLAWLALERSGRWMLVVAALVGAALLFASMLIGNAVQGTFGDGHEGTSAWGLTVWRVALLLVVLTATRAAVQSEAADAAARRS